MSSPYFDEDEKRAQGILDAAAGLITRFGYDKTTMSDIAEEAGVTRAIVYLHFDNKDVLFEALLYRETRKYLNAWVSALERDQGAGAISAAFRSALAAVRQSPFMSALMKQDRRVFGKYLRKSGNIFESVQSFSTWPEILRALQEVGAVRKDVSPAVLGHMMNALALGLITLEDTRKGAPEPPSFEAVLEATAEMMDRMLTPADDGNQTAGKELIRQLALSVKAQFEQPVSPAA